MSSAYFIKRQGGNRAQILTAFAGIIAGLVVLGPIGIIVGPLLGVFAVAWYQSRDYRSSLTAATSVILAFISSSIVKFLLQLVVIVWFFLEIF